MDKRKERMYKRVIVISITIIVIVILFYAFAIRGKNSNDLANFFGYSALTTFITLIVADIWLGENSGEAFDMPAAYFDISPINVIVQPFFAIFLIIFCFMKAVMIVMK